MNPIRQTAIQDGLARLGVSPGHAVVVHGSLKSFGCVAGGAPSVVSALVETIGPHGLIIMPAYACSLDAAGDILPVPHPEARVTTGAIAAAFGARGDVMLARHPLYAFAFHGAASETLARRHARLMFPYAKDQPLYCLHARRGHVLQLGVDDRTNTSIHAAEEIADPPYLAAKKSQSHLTVGAYFAMNRAQRRRSLAEHRAGPRRDFRKATPIIEQAGIRRSTMVGCCRATLTSFVPLIELLVKRMREEPDLLLSS